MKHEIAEHLFTVSDLLTPAECEELIARGERLGFAAATVAMAGGPRILNSVRNNDRVSFDDPTLADWLWERLKPHVRHGTDGAAAAGLNDRLRLYRYEPAQRFNAHRDGVVQRSTDERSRLTLLIYLNGGTEGGQTVFYSEDRVGGLRRVVASVEPREGMGLVFAHGWWHEGAKVTGGRKYVLRTDVFYRDVPAPAAGTAR